MAGVAVLGLGMYAASLSGEWTEAELKEKKMVSWHYLTFYCVVVNYNHCPAPVDVGERAFDEVGANGRESQWRV